MTGDRLVDRVARDMVAVPPLGLRPRVLARLASPPPPVWRSRVAAAAVLVAVVTAGAVGWLLRLDRAGSSATTGVERPDISSGNAGTGTGGDAPVVLAVSRDAAPTLLEPGAAPVVRSPVAAAKSAEELAWEARAVTPLQAPSALIASPTQPDPLTFPLLLMTPLPIDPVAVPPLGAIVPLISGPFATES
jgi:hypothetical protein